MVWYAKFKPACKLVLTSRYVSDILRNMEANNTPEFIIIGFLMLQTAGSLYMFATRRRTRTRNNRMRAALKTALQTGRV